MSQAPSVAFAVVDGDSFVAGPASVSLKGTTRGLEILISSAPSSDALAARLSELLAEAPGFFAGSDARVAFEGALPSGALGCLEAVAARFQLTIVELGPVTARRARTYASVIRRNDARRGKLAEGTGPIAEAAAPSAELPALPSETASPEAAVIAAAPDTAEADAPEATPIEVALANTAPYSIADLASEAAPRLGAAPALASATPARNAAAIEAAVAHAVDAIASVATVNGRGTPPDGSAAEWGRGSIDAIASAIAEADSEILAAELIGDLALEAIAGELNAASELFAAPPVVDPAAVAAASEAEAAARAVAIEAAAEARAAELIAALPPTPRLVIGPVRSGVIVDHPGHVVVIGDVNPGAEVRAVGSIIVLGRLRGVAHAAIGRDTGCIVALNLQPQQLRIGRMVARAGDADRPSDGAEIAYVTGEAIVVERFVGRLPSGLAASM